MKTKLLPQIFILLFISQVQAEKIFLMNSNGYNKAEPQLINAIINQGHTVTIDSVNFSALPSGFTSSCVDPLNGYDWLCFFGDTNYAPLLPQIQAFIDAGGKVFFQYEVGCCLNSSSGIATILSGLTGLTITPNSNNYIASPINAPVLQGWMSNSIDTCLTIIGSAYKGLDGVPLNRQFIADSTLYNSTPPVSTCPNFGFHFTTTDFTGTANNGAITGFGDINLWYKGDEPFWNNGQTPVDTNVIKYFFPNSEENCYLFHTGCILGNTSDLNELSNSGNGIKIYPNPLSSSTKLEIPFYSETITLQWIDELGKCVRTNKLLQGSNELHKENLADGFYTGLVISGDKVLGRMKIVVQ